MKIGFKALAISANAQLEEDEEGEAEEIGGCVWGLTIVLSLVLAVGLFFVIPVGLTSLIKDQLGSPLLFWLVEGVLRTAIFIGYIVAISRLPRPAAGLRVPRRRAQDDLLLRGRGRADPARAKLYSRLHPRCGTSFLLIVMVLAIFVFAPLGLPAWYWLRRLADPRHPADRRPLLRGDQVGRARTAASAGCGRVMWPGLMLQNLTTREPDDEQLAVAIAVARGGARARRRPRQRPPSSRSRSSPNAASARAATCSDRDRVAGRADRDPLRRARAADVRSGGDRRPRALRRGRARVPRAGAAPARSRPSGGPCGDDLEGARELLDEDGDDAELQAGRRRGAGAARGARGGDPPGDGRARPQRRQERARRDPGRHRGRRGGALRRRPLQDAHPLRRGARLLDRGRSRSRRPRSAASRR